MRIVEVYDCNSKCSQHIASYKCQITSWFLVEGQRRVCPRSKRGLQIKHIASFSSSGIPSIMLCGITIFYCHIWHAYAAQTYLLGSIHTHVFCPAGTRHNTSLTSSASTNTTAIRSDIQALDKITITSYKRTSILYPAILWNCSE